MRAIITALALSFSSTAAAQNVPTQSAVFEWPQATAGVIPDLRVERDVRAAGETARQARERATEGSRVAGQAKRRAGLQGAFGIKPRRATVDDNTVVAATRGYSEGHVLGSITYSTGATMTGAFGPDLGRYIAAPQSPLRQFTGWIFGAGTGAPRPIDGIFEWKNGDVFTGSITGDGSASKGIYVEAGGQRRFVGVIDLSQSVFRPVRGYLQDARGRLIGVVRRD